MSISNDPSKAIAARGKFGPVSALLVTFLAYLGSQLAAIVALAGSYSLISGKDSEEVLRGFTGSITGQFLFIALTEVAVLAIIFWFMRYRKISLREIGPGRPPKLSDIFRYLINQKIIASTATSVSAITGTGRLSNR